ncbi:hypothetical protein DFQ28_007250 [Apophysomyces sp. BC1034]|nr:hypothetical protein DFQ30_006346 [Apophysomyces sp. BC1015]KAG0182288.1 hypothetical protein DFQ29_005019 [Apophysomyces sp. BC1021]KAG0192907.1 hypothetical protein DFQ28_007250 [Apophysomyces sp. BC1034]
MSQNFDLPSAPQQSEDEDRQQPQDTPPTPQPLQTSTNRFPPPRSVSYGPQRANEGDVLQVELSLANTEILSLLRIAFGAYIGTTRLLGDGSTDLITLTTTVPNWQMTQTADWTRVPIYLLACSPSESQEVLDSWFVGYFCYSFSRKRSSAELRLDYESIVKRSRVNEPMPTEDDTAAAAAAVAYMVPSYSNYSNYYDLPHAQYMGQYAQQLQSPVQPQAQAPQADVPTRSREYFADPAVASAQMMSYPYRPPLGSDPGFSAYPGADPAASLSGLSAGLSQMSQHPHVLSHPPSVETIQPPTTSSAYVMPPSHSHPQPIQPSSSYMEPIAPAASHIAPAHAAPGTSSTAEGYNPFAHVLNNPTLRIENDLSDMVRNWTPEEMQNRRRLVRFWRRQEGNEITTSCAPIELPEDRREQLQDMTIVSCIYWEERDDYVITSVDCINLLEHLIGVRFTVEEKNRIRRNLEGFKPLTVSKQKDNSAEFFKVIMGFPNPKPRNIEKDVKVFPWSKLAEALKKIIGKYTPSYSSTASVNVEVFSGSSTGPGLSEEGSVSGGNE